MFSKKPANTQKSTRITPPRRPRAADAAAATSTATARGHVSPSAAQTVRLVDGMIALAADVAFPALTGVG